jgi:hypothetical protein
MKLKSIALAVTTVCVLAGGNALAQAPAKPAAKPAAPAAAGAKAQFIPVLSYRTGAYAPNGTPWANGFIDYMKLVNARGGLNGVKLTWEECETGYDTARSVECYERLKGKGASLCSRCPPACHLRLTEKAPADKIPVVTVGYGRSESADGSVFKWNFPIAGTYWVAADAILQAIGKKEGSLDKLKGKKIALVYHDSPYGKEPIAAVAGTLQDARLRPAAAAGHASGSRAEGHLAADPPVAPGLRAAVGLGRDEFHLAEGGPGHRLPARQDVRRVVVGRRAGRQGRRRRRQGLQRGDHAARRRAAVQAGQGRAGHGARQGARHRAQGPKSARCCTCAAP